MTSTSLRLEHPLAARLALVPVDVSLRARTAIRKRRWPPYERTYRGATEAEARAALVAGLMAERPDALLTTRSANLPASQVDRYRRALTFPGKPGLDGIVS